MCLSTAYLNHKDEDKVVARYVAEIRTGDGSVTLVDVMGQELTVEGRISWVDLTGGTVIIETDAA